MPVAWDDFEPVETADKWADFEPVDAPTIDTAAVQKSSAEGMARLPGGMMDPGDPAQGIRDMMGNAKTLPQAMGNIAGNVAGAVGGLAMMPGKIAYLSAVDAVAGLQNIDHEYDITGAPKAEYGGNIFSDRGSGDAPPDVLPIDKFLAGTSETSPNLTVAAKIARGAAESSPLFAAGMLPAWAQRLTALGFGIDMISKAPDQARRLGEEMGLPPEQQDQDLITTLKSDLLQTAGFAPMAMAHAGKLKPSARNPAWDWKTGFAPTGKGLRETFADVPQSPLTEPVNLPGAVEATPEAPAAQPAETATRARTALPLRKVAQGDLIPEKSMRELAGLAPEAILSPEHEGLVNAGKADLDVPVDVVPDTPSGDEPAASNRRVEGQFMGINRAKNSIEIYPEEFAHWLEGVPEELRPQAVKSRLAEERIHLATDDAAAKTYWSNLTGLEQKISNRRYLGKHSGAGISPTMMGHEALRFRIQQLMDMTPSELAETAGREHWTLKGLTIVESAIRGIRETIGTKASVAQQAILERVQHNLGIAKAALGGNVAAVNRTDEPTDREKYDALVAKIKAAPTFDEKMALQPQIEAIKNKYGGKIPPQDAPAAVNRGMSKAAAERIRKAQELQESRLAAEAGGAYSAAAGEHLEALKPTYEAPTPTALDDLAAKHIASERPSFEDFLGDAQVKFGKIERGAMLEKWGDALNELVTAPGDMLKELVESLNLRPQVMGPENRAGKGGRPIMNRTLEIPDAKVAGTGNQGAEVTRAQAIKRSELLVELAGKLERQADSAAKNLQSMGNTPGFNRLSTEGDVTSLRARANKLRKQADDLVDRVKRGQSLPVEGKTKVMKQQTPSLFGEQTFTTGDAPLEVGQETAKTGGERARARAISAITTKLWEEAVGGTADLRRKEVTPDEIRWSKGEQAYEAIPTDMAEEDIGRFATKGAGMDRTTKTVSGERRVTRKALPESATKRVVVLQDKRTGEVHVVSAYRDAGEPVVVNPSDPGGKHRAFKDVLRGYRTLYSMLLDEPVQNFKKSFASLDEYNAQFGDHAQELLKEHGHGEYGVGPVEGFEAEGTPGLKGQPGYNPHGVLESGADLQPQESRALYDVFDSIERPQDAHEYFDKLSQRAKGDRLTARDRVVVSGLKKVYEALSNEPATRDMTDGQKIEYLVDELYDTAKRNETRSSFVEAAANRFARESALPPEPQAKESQTARELTGQARTEPIPGGATSSLENLSRQQIPPAESAASTAKDIYQNVKSQQRLRARNEELRRGKSNLSPKYEGVVPWDTVDPQSPAAVNRLKESAQEEASKVKAEIGAWASRRDAEETMAYTLDAAEASGNTFADAAAMAIKLESAKGHANQSVAERAKNIVTSESKALGRAVQRKFGERSLAATKAREWGREADAGGNPDKLRAANAMLASGAFEAKYKLDAEAQAELGKRVMADPDYEPAMKLAKSQGPQHVEQWRAIINKIEGKAIRDMLQEGLITHSGVEYNFNEAARDKLDKFEGKVDRAIEKATAQSKSGTFLERRRGKKWLQAALDLKSEIQYARQNWADPELRSTTKAMRGEMDQQYDREVDAGKNVRYDESYLPGRYDADLFNDNSVTFGRLGILGKKWGGPKTFQNYYDAIEAGPYVAATRDGAAIVSHRVRQGMRAINRGVWSEDLKFINDPDSGKPVVVDPVKKDGEWQPPNAEYELAYPFGKAKPVAVRRSFSRMFRSLTAPSAVQDFEIKGLPVGQMALDFTQKLKHAVLVGDLFHLGRVGYYATSILGKNVGWKGGLSALEYRPNDLQRAVDRGMIRQQDADWARGTVTVNTGKGRTTPMTRLELAQEFTMAGLNIGRIQDAIYKDLVGQVPFVGRYNKFLFDKLTRGLMMESAIKEFERANMTHPDANLRDMTRDIAKDLNNYYGSIGRQGWIKNATLQDLARMSFLAPQWTEGLVMKEAGAYKRAAMSVPRALGYEGPGSRRGLPAMGTLGRGVGRGLAAMTLLTQVINLITRRQPTWKNDEEGHKWDAWIPDVTGKTEGFFFSPLSVFNELTHDVLRLGASKDQFAEVGQQIAMNKLHPAVRAAYTLASGTTPYGEHTRTFGGRLAATAQEGLPIPVSFGKMAQAAGNAIAPGMVSPPQPGSVQRQAIGSLGIKVEPAASPSSRVRQLAKDYLSKTGQTPVTGWQQVQTDEPSYTKLRAALYKGDDKGAKAMLEHLKETHKPKPNARGIYSDPVEKAMREWVATPFTGNKKTEQDFMWSMHEQGKDALYQRAQEEKQEIYNRFVKLYMAQP